MQDRELRLTEIRPEELYPPGNTDGKTGHLIRIESPNGPTSEGRCKLCGFEKTYRNFPESNFAGYDGGKKIYSIDRRITPKD